MRRTVMAGVVVSCALVLVAGAAIPVQRVALSPDAPTRTTTQVEVTNFPAVQAVGGSVNVGNLPAVQSVAGSVQVTNLPLDGDGNLRVAGAASGPAFRFTKLVDGLNLTDGDQYVIGPVQTGGWRTAEVYLRMTGISETVFGTNFCLIADVLFGGDDFHFLNVSDTSTCYSGAGTIRTNVLIVPVRGPEITLRITTPSGPQGNATLEAWLYLSN